jgi:hypothetical protein
MRRANVKAAHIIEWMEHPAFFTALALTLRRRFGHERGGAMLTVLFRFFLSQPLPKACDVRDFGEPCFFPETEVSL